MNVCHFVLPIGKIGEIGGYFSKLFSMVLYYFTGKIHFFWGIEFLFKTPYFPYFLVKMAWLCDFWIGNFNCDFPISLND